jgi:hypothetical protein
MHCAVQQAFRFQMLALVIAGAASSCTLNTDVSSPSALIKFSGDQQSAPVNTMLPTPLAIVVISQFGERLKNITVNWTIVSGGGSLSSNTTLTDETGVASVNYTTGTVAGPAVVRAQVHGIPPLTFNITIT